MPQIYKTFAYDSLINHTSLSHTAPKARSIIPAKTFGLRRIFNLASTNRYDPLQQAPVCVLKAESVASNVQINGTCFEMDEDCLQNLLNRESGDQFKPIEVSHDDNHQFTTHYFTAKGFQPYRYLVASSEQKHYLSLCIKGGTTSWSINNEIDRWAIGQGEY